jgi:hypothetical protein
VVLEDVCRVGEHALAEVEQPSHGAGLAQGLAVGMPMPVVTVAEGT